LRRCAWRGFGIDVLTPPSPQRFKRFDAEGPKINSAILRCGIDGTEADDARA
jgi:hypothetical protein